jgi:hypothetical protein
VPSPFCVHDVERFGRLRQKDDDSPVSANGNGHTVAVAGHESVPHPIAIGILPKETDRDDAVLEAVKDIDLRLRWVFVNFPIAIVILPIQRVFINSSIMVIIP